MDELVLRVRTFVYSMICFQCLIQLTAGNPFHKYLKLFSQLIAISICCNIFFSFFGIVESGWEQADEIYERWQIQWSGEQELAGMDGYLQKNIMEKSMDEFKEQIDELLNLEGAGKYQLKWIEQDKGGKCNIVIQAVQGQEDENFVVAFKAAVCEKFSIQEDQVEVRMQ